MPQTRFVLSRALELGHRVIVVVNKIDRPDQRIHEVVDEVLELLLDLDATPEQLDSPMLFCSGRNGTASYSPDEPGTDLKPLFDTILNYIPAPEADVDQPFQMLVSAIDYNEFVGRMAIGRIERGALKQNQEIMVCNYHNPDAAPKKAKAVSLYEFDGLGKKPVTESTAGNIICLSGIGDITIGDTICAPECVEALPFVKISAPTMEMTFSINDSPFAGRDGKFVTSRQLRERLFRETLKMCIRDREQGVDGRNRLLGVGVIQIPLLKGRYRQGIGGGVAFFLLHLADGVLSPQPPGQSVKGPQGGVHAHAQGHRKGEQHRHQKAVCNQGRRFDLFFHSCPSWSGGHTGKVMVTVVPASS